MYLSGNEIEILQSHSEAHKASVCEHGHRQVGLEMRCVIRFQPLF
jgi:hypothetical protein